MPLIPSTVGATDIYKFQWIILCSQEGLQLKQDLEDLKIKIPSKILQHYNADILDASSTICRKKEKMSLMLENKFFSQKF